MKTSNKILIAIAVFIVGGIVTLFITANQHDKELKSYKTEVLQLQPFSVIVAEEGSKCNVRNVIMTHTVVKNESGKVISESSKNMNEIHIIYNPKNKVNLQSIFKQKGDTLFIYKGAKVRILTSEKIRTIVGQKHELLFLEGVSTDTLLLDGGKTNTARLTCNNKTLHLSAKSTAEVNLDFENINHLNILANHSTILLLNSVNESATGVKSIMMKTLNIELKDKSNLITVVESEFIKIEKDKSSVLRIVSNTAYSYYFNDFNKALP